MPCNQNIHLNCATNSVYNIHHFCHLLASLLILCAIYAREDDCAYAAEHGMGHSMHVITDGWVDIDGWCASQSHCRIWYFMCFKSNKIKYIFTFGLLSDGKMMQVQDCCWRVNNITSNINIKIQFYLVMMVTMLSENCRVCV